MTGKTYGLFCPVSKACEIIEPRWTLQILAEMAAGATRFNELRNGMPGISPSLLSKRLKEMERNGLIEKTTIGSNQAAEYIRTERALELHPIVVALGEWAQRNVDPDTALCATDARTLMWYVRRKIVREELPKKRCVLHFHFTDAKEGENKYWLIAKPGQGLDICLSDPGFEVDLFIDTTTRILTAALFGRCSFLNAIDNEQIRLIGSLKLRRSITSWLSLSKYAKATGTQLLPN